MNRAATLPFLSQLVFEPRRLRSQHQRVTVASRERRMMSRNAILTLENRRLQLHVLTGCVWITRDGCPADTVLWAGAVFEQQPGAPVLVQALEEAELLIAGAVADTQNA